MGTRQTGLPDLRMARMSDQDILSLARREAIGLLDSDPDLSRKENVPLGERFKAYAAGLPGEMS